MLLPYSQNCYHAVNKKQKGERRMKEQKTTIARYFEAYGQIIKEEKNPKDDKELLDLHKQLQKCIEGER